MSYKGFSMDLKSMPIKLIFRKLIHKAILHDERRFDYGKASGARKLEDFERMEKVWQEARGIGLFGQINTDSDWETVRSRIDMADKDRSRQMPVYANLLRIAGIVVLTAGLTIGVYKTIAFFSQKNAGSLITVQAGDKPREILLPDASTVSLNAGSRLTYNSEYNHLTREVNLQGEAFFDVIPDKMHPFKVYTGQSVIVVTGTRFTVREDVGSVKVAVLTGTVLLSNTSGEHPNQISISANQSGVLLSGNELKVENGIEANTLSWKTGHLIFDETPIDSALIDIAHHFRKELSIQTEISDEITAEFQDQPLGEILNEINLVAGLKFDTTRTTLIVRK
jgi:transmembrane sensor